MIPQNISNELRLLTSVNHPHVMSYMNSLKHISMSQLATYSARRACKLTTDAHPSLIQEDWNTLHCSIEYVSL